MRFHIIVLLIISIFAMSLPYNAYAASPSNDSYSQTASSAEQDNTTTKNASDAPEPTNPDASKEAVKDFGGSVFAFVVIIGIIVGTVALAAVL